MKRLINAPAWRNRRAMAGKLLGALAIAAVVVIAAVLAGCGGKQEGQIAPTGSPQVSPTTMPTERPTTSEEYRAEMVSLLPDIEQIFSVEWPEALGTEPLGGEAWQEAVSALAARIDGLRVRIEMLEVPDDWAVSHALMVDSLSKTAEAVREARIAFTSRDAQGIRDAVADVQNAFAVLDEATKQMPPVR